MSIPQHSKLKLELIEIFKDLIAEWIELEDFTGQMLEEAIMEALSHNVSYCRESLIRAERLTEDYQNADRSKFKTETEKKLHGDLPECDI